MFRIWQMIVRRVCSCYPWIEMPFSHWPRPRCRVLGHHVVLCVQEDAEIGQPGDRIELHIGIGEDSTAPEASVREFPCLLGLLLHKMGVHGVAIEEQDDAIPEGNVGGKIKGITQMRRRLVQIEDQVAQSTAKQVRTHPVVQGALLVAIVHAGVEEIAHGEQVVHLKVVRMLQYALLHQGDVLRLRFRRLLRLCALQASRQTAHLAKTEHCQGDTFIMNFL